MSYKEKILISGAGPSGLLLASLLLKQGVSFTFIDKGKGSMSSKNLKVVMLHEASIEIFRDLELYDEIKKLINPLETIEFHCDKEKIAKFSIKELFKSFSLWMLHQDKIEELLERHLQDRGIKILWDHELISGEEEKEDGVTVKIRKPNGTISSEFYHYIFACDGYSSEIRKQLQINFTGETYKEAFSFIDVKMQPLSKGSAIIHMGSEHNVVVIPVDGEQCRVIIANAKEQDHTHSNREQLETFLKREIGNEVTCQELNWGMFFHAYVKESSQYQKKKCFLVGESAHSFSPLGGLGLNVYFQDAYNLAWKVAFVEKGLCVKELLNTYEIERKFAFQQTLKLSKYLNKWLLRRRKSTFLRTMLSFLSVHPQVCQKFIKNKYEPLFLSYRACKTFQRDVFFGLTQFSRAFRRAPHSGDKALDCDIVVRNDLSTKTFFDYLRKNFPCIVLFLTAEIEKYPGDLKEIEIYMHKAKVLKSFTKQCLVVRNLEFPHKNEWEYDVIYDFDGRLHELYGAKKPCMYYFRPDKHIGFRIPKISYFLERKSAYRKIFYAPIKARNLSI